MRNKGKLIRQFLILLKNIDAKEVQIKELKAIFRNDRIIGFSLQVKEKKPSLKVVDSDKKTG